MIGRSALADPDLALKFSAELGIARTETFDSIMRAFISMVEDSFNNAERRSRDIGLFLASETRNVAGVIGQQYGEVRAAAEAERERTALVLQETYAQASDRVGFADGFPLLLIGQASLDELSARVGRPLEMLRFRPNLVISGSAAYAEDSWQRIRIGALEFRLVKGCSRCIMTTLDPLTGERSDDREPLATLKTYRARDGEVYFGQNLLHSGPGELAVGMGVEVLE